MLTREEFDIRSNALRASLRVKLGVRSTSLPQALKKSRRLLPRSARASAEVLKETQNKLAHPKIARQIDYSVIDRAFETIEEYLNKIDPKERGKDALLNWLAVLIINLILLTVLIFLVLRWRGFI